MNREELKKYFAKPMYNDVREFVYLVMLEHPEVTEPYTVEAAACEIQDCRINGVELSTDDALRLVKGEKPPKMEDILKKLSDAGITNDNILDVIESADTDESEGTDRAVWVLSEDALRQKELLENGADLLVRNRDIVLLGRPIPEKGADWMQLELGFFSENFGPAEEKTLVDMKSCADDTAIIEKGNYAKVVFKIRDIWID